MPKNKETLCFFVFLCFHKQMKQTLEVLSFMKLEQIIFVKEAVTFILRKQDIFVKEAVTFILRKQDIFVKEVLSFIMKKHVNFLKEVVSFLKKLLVSRKHLAKAKYEDTYLLTTFKLYHVF